VVERGTGAEGDDWIRVKPENLPAVLQDLRGQGYEQWCFMTCVDHLDTPVVPAPPDRYELVYQLRRMSDARMLRVRIFVGGPEPRAPSVCHIHPPADWDERETYDLFGIRFDGHPDLTRILMPDDWVGHPLRRDYPVGGEPVEFTEEHESWQRPPPLA
jgi:NADH-quinone oxidoreductase subunit C